MSGETLTPASVAALGEIARELHAAAAEAERTGNVDCLPSVLHHVQGWRKLLELKGPDSQRDGRERRRKNPGTGAHDTAPETWIAMRKRYEGTPGVTLLDVVREFGVLYSAAHDRARREQWCSPLDRETTERRAQVQAEALKVIPFARLRLRRIARDAARGGGDPLLDDDPPPTG